MNPNLNLGSLTNSLRGIWDELVERRLWPVAVVLALALVAVPVVLSKPAASPPPSPPAPMSSGAAGSPLTAFQPAVSTEGEKSSEIRKNLQRFKEKNPFAPKGSVPGGGTGAASPGDAVPPASTASTSAGTTSPTTGSTSTGTSTGTSGSQTGTSPGIAYFKFTVQVRFGKKGNLDTKNLTQFRALPSSEDPVLVFMGVRGSQGTAVFLVSSDATTKGQGQCQPREDECTFLYMQKGDTRTIEAVTQGGDVVTYVLELRKIDVKQTSSPYASRSKSRSKSRSSHRRHSARASKRARAHSSHRKHGRKAKASRSRASHHGRHRARKSRVGRSHKRSRMPQVTKSFETFGF